MLILVCSTREVLGQQMTRFSYQRTDVHIGMGLDMFSMKTKCGMVMIAGRLPLQERRSVALKKQETKWLEEESY